MSDLRGPSHGLVNKDTRGVSSSRVCVLGVRRSGSALVLPRNATPFHARLLLIAPLEEDILIPIPLG